MSNHAVATQRKPWMGAALLVAFVAACATPGENATGKVAERPVAAADSEPMTPLGSYLAGRHAQHQHDYGAAARFFGDALAQDPGDFELMNRTFLFDTSEGRIAKAAGLAEQINRIDPASPLPNLVLAIAKLKSGDLQAAAAQSEALPREGIHRFMTPLAIAWTKAGLGQTDAALAALAPLAETKGFAPLADFQTGLIAEFAGRDGEAEAAYQRTVQAAPRANWRSLETLGRLYERTGRPDDARALYRRFLDENPESDLAGAAMARVDAGGRSMKRVTGPADGVAEALFDMASLLNQNETTDLALIYARLALDLRPDFPLAQLLLADIAEAQARPAEALAEYRAIAPQSPYGWTARLRQAADLEAMGQTDDAIATLRALAAERADRTQPLVQLGDFLRGKNRFAEAVEAYDQAIGRVGTPQARHWTLLYSRGVALERSGQWPRAEADLKRALELQPDQPLVLNYLGYAWVDKGEHLNDALHMIERAVELRPNDGYIVDSLGWALYRMGNFAKATEQLEHAVELRPDDPTINDHLGDAYWQTGRVVEARNQWRRALQFGPEAADAKTIEAKLDRGIAKPGPGGNSAQGG